MTTLVIFAAIYLCSSLFMALIIREYCADFTDNGKALLLILSPVIVVLLVVTVVYALLAGVIEAFFPKVGDDE